MSAHTSANITLPKPVLGYHPGTFLERGASVPFITPQLNGARARPGSRGGPVPLRGKFHEPARLLMHDVDHHSPIRAA